MDYTIDPCASCGYALPVTWTDRQEMSLVLECLGWHINPTVCPACRRRNGKRKMQRTLLQQLRFLDSN